MSDHQRDLVRLSTSTILHLSSDLEEGDYVCVLTDVSEGGLHCRSYPNSSLPPLGAELRCNFVLPSGKVHAKVRVAWVRDDECGLEFTNVIEGAEMLSTYCNAPW